MNLPITLPARYTEENPLYLDNTTLSALSTCSTQALLSYHHHLQSLAPSPNLLAGTAAHEALASYLRESNPTSAMTVFRNAYFPWASQFLSVESPLSWENTSVSLEHWFATHQPDSPTFPKPIPSSLEAILSHPLWEEVWGKRVIFVGLVDGIVQNPATGLLSLMDHKTTSFSLTKFYADQFILSSQLSGYLWLAQQNAIHDKLNSPYPISTVLINAIQFAKLPDSTRKCPLHSLPYLECRRFHANSALLGPFSRTPNLIETWHRNAIALTQRWIALKETFPSLNNFSTIPKDGQFAYNICPRCSFFGPCRGMIPPESLEMAYTTREWTPWKGKSVGED